MQDAVVMGVVNTKANFGKKIDAFGTTVTFSEDIDGNASYTLSAQYEGVTIMFNGTDYSVIGKY